MARRNGFRRVTFIITAADYAALKRHATDWHMRTETLLRKLSHSAACSARAARSSSQRQGGAIDETGSGFDRFQAMTPTNNVSPRSLRTQSTDPATDQPGAGLFV